MRKLLDPRGQCALGLVGDAFTGPGAIKQEVRRKGRACPDYGWTSISLRLRGRRASIVCGQTGRTYQGYQASEKWFIHHGHLAQMLIELNPFVLGVFQRLLKLTRLTQLLDGVFETRDQLFRITR